jgi:penicillin-binding protein 1C
MRQSDRTRVAAPAQPTVQARRPVAPARPVRRKGNCLLQSIIIITILGAVGVALAVAAASIGYVVIASQLPPPGELRSRASSFETAQILDRNGQLLYSLADPNTGNRTYVSLAAIDQDLIDATIATEDSRFYTNPGFDPVAIVRAVALAAIEDTPLTGASTITQQLARALLLEEEERTQRTFSRKVKEIVLAAEINRTYSKDEILELYLNEINYGNRAYGIEAAAQTYFNKPASELSVAEASLLAGLPQAPALWDPFTQPESALGRQREVLGLMTASGYITLAEAQAAIEESAPVVRAMEPPDVVIRFPHFVFTVLQQLEEQIGAQAIYRGGLRVFTTLDPAVQSLAEEAVAQNREGLAAGGANNAALVALDPRTGEVLALVGSVDFNDEGISGQVNMALSPRQTGSAIKPLVYLTAFEQGWTPATLLWDVPTSFPDGANPPYTPKNYDDEFHGPQRIRPALGNSYNIPAVKALEFIGVCNFIVRAQALGLASLQDSGCQESGQPREHGLSLTLGGGEVSPLEMAGAFGVLANQGRLVPPFTIARIETRAGDLVTEHQAPEPQAGQVARAEHAYLLSDILSDDAARQAEFGANSPLNIPGHDVAAKTGTSGTTGSDVRDTWTVGYTPEIVAAVWAGNTDNQPLAPGQSGLRTAVPIWNAFMTGYLSGRQPQSFPRPPGVVEVEICADSGARPGPGCRNRAVEMFASDQLPPGPEQDVFRPVSIDLWTNQVANQFCPESVYEANFFNLVVNARPEVVAREQGNARNWLEQSAGGQAWAAARSIAIPLALPPASECNESTPRPRVTITQPAEGQQVGGIVDIVGTAMGPNVAGYQMEYGLTHDPQGWGLIQALQPLMVDNGILARWDSQGVSGGPVTIRAILFGPNNPYTPDQDPVALEARVRLSLTEPTGTPTATATSTGTATATPSPSVTPSPSPSGTPTLFATPAATPQVTPTGPVPIETLTPKPTP